MPILTHITEREREICRLDVGIASRLRNSSYYLTEAKKADARTRPVLRPTDLNKDFFPQSIWDAYFNPKKRPAGAAPPRGKKKKTKVDWSSLGVETEGGAGAVDLDGADERASQEGGDEEGGDNVEEMEDYEEEADDNDYEMNYFDNGEDENDDLGDGGGDPDGGGGGDVMLSEAPRLKLSPRRPFLQNVSPLPAAMNVLIRIVIERYSPFV
ncbi:hypothetical protein FRC04_005810 [Tulasnella sp. 424]|nr:hypothetical protein FRC04_005810 [Tulasnella sp. 424]